MLDMDRPDPQDCAGHLEWSTLLAVQAVWHVPCGGVAYGDSNLVFVANDWHTALLPVYLQAYYRDHGLMEFARSILVIHNMAHQGRGPVAEYAWLGLPAEYLDKFKLYDPIGGEHMNIFMAGLICAHRLVAVSHGYAWECQTQVRPPTRDAVHHRAAVARLERGHCQPPVHIARNQFTCPWSW
jgi:hypothetical protein